MAFLTKRQSVEVMVLPNPLLRLLTKARLGTEAVASSTKRRARKSNWPAA
jgi:hypothetical protein